MKPVLFSVSTCISEEGVEVYNNAPEATITSHEMGFRVGRTAQQSITWRKKPKHLLRTTWMLQNHVNTRKEIRILIELLYWSNERQKDTE